MTARQSSMQPGRRFARRRALLRGALVLLPVLPTTPARAQDARQTLVQGIARDWIALVDAKRYEDSWNATGAKFRLAMTPERWSQLITKARAPLGAVVKRTVLRTSFTRSFPGVPEGDYAIVIFRAAYANRDDGDETVTLEREADGVWRVIGYVVR